MALPTRPLSVALDVELLVILSFSCGLAPPGTRPPLSQRLLLLGYPLPPYLFPSLPRLMLPSELPDSAKSPRSLLRAVWERSLVTHPCSFSVSRAGECQTASPGPRPKLLASLRPILLTGGPRGLGSSHSRKTLRRLAGGRTVQTGSHDLVLVMVTASGQGSPAVDLRALSLLLKSLLSDSRASLL